MNFEVGAEVDLGGLAPFADLIQEGDQDDPGHLVRAGAIEARGF